MKWKAFTKRRRELRALGGVPSDTKDAPIIRSKSKVEKSRFIPEVIMEENEEEQVSPTILHSNLVIPKLDLNFLTDG